MGKIRKDGKLVPHELSELAIQNCLTMHLTCTLLFSRHKKKQFLYPIVSGDENWIYYNNSKHKES